jgi:hypothetical protein
MVVRDILWDFLCTVSLAVFAGFFAALGRYSLDLSVTFMGVIPVVVAGVFMGLLSVISVHAVRYSATIHVPVQINQSSEHFHTRQSDPFLLATVYDPFSLEL